MWLSAERGKGMKVQSRGAKRSKMQFLLNLLWHEVHPNARKTHPFSRLFPLFLSRMGSEEGYYM